MICYVVRKSLYVAKWSVSLICKFDVIVRLIISWSLWNSCDCTGNYRKLSCHAIKGDDLKVHCSQTITPSRKSYQMGKYHFIV
jgi:hypothetical protein